MRCAIQIAVAVAVAIAPACKRDEARFEHAEEHPEGHDHHDEGHGHGDSPMVRITKWSSTLELFAEHSVPVVGAEVSVLAHLTVLDGFGAVQSGKVRFELTGPASLTAEASAPTRPGIYALAFTPTVAGKYRGRFVLQGPVSGAVDGIEVVVHADAEVAEDAEPHEGDEGLIELLKEQQWGVPFATQFAEESSVVASILVAGTVDTPPGGSAVVGAPVPGRIIAPSAGLPRPGDLVSKGRVLASLQPAPSSPEDAARMSLAEAEAAARSAGARAALERAERLMSDQAISQRELEEARREAKVAEEGVRAAARAAEMFAGATSGAGSGAWRLVAPIDGVLTDVRATPGASVSPQEVLFRIIDARELWIRARVPEQDAAHLRTDRPAFYQVAGIEKWMPIPINTKNASVVTVGRTVDLATRTVDVIYALREPDATLRVGGLVQVSVPVGDEFRGVVVPPSALLYEEGREYVYVQIDGEHFQERAVITGPRAGDLLGIQRGLRAGERVVTKGANLVRLSDRARSSEPHGHIH